MKRHLLYSSFILPLVFSSGTISTCFALSEIVKSGTLAISSEASTATVGKIKDEMLLIQSSRLEMQNTFNLVIGFTIALLVVCSFLLYRLNVNQKQVGEELDNRVRERTRELIANRDLVMRINDEHKMLLQVLSKKLGSSLATVQGLSLIAAKEPVDIRDDYSQRLGGVANQIDEVVKAMQRYQERPKNQDFNL